MSRRPRYSVVVPVHNEEETLRELVSRLVPVLDGLDGESEVIVVDDGSTDDSWALLRELRASEPRLRLVRLSRNFGHQIAITAGTDRARGDAVVIMDADLQDPPELVPELVDRWREGFEVVYAVREDRDEPFVRRTARSLAYRALRRVARIDLPLNAGDFRLVDRRALDAFRSMRESNRYIRGMFSWIGFTQTGVVHRRPERFAGKTKYSWGRLARLGIDGVVSFSDAPLRAALTIGFLVSGASFLFAIGVLISRVAGYRVVPGWASLVLIVSLLGGIQLIVMGTMGLYVARIHEEVKGRPLYLTRELDGFEDDARAQPEGAGEQALEHTP